jgi:general nucleoside transport system ATP-binding protein
MSQSTPPAVEMLNITKRFPGVVANRDATLIVQKGEIHALLGENGAGKSTLMNVLAGLYLQEEGEVRIHGRSVTIGSPRDAFDLGIAMVHQHFKLVLNQTVSENVILGMDDPRIHLDMRQVKERIESVGRQYDILVDPDAYIWQLSVGEQQRVEILKALYRGADILILDEPTAVLTPQEAVALGQTLEKIVEEGKTIIFISHKLDEVIRFADQVTVLRKGEVVATEPVTEETSTTHLAQLMVGRSVLFRIEKERVAPGGPCLEVVGISALNEKRLPALRDVSFEVRSGEIFGIAGVAGNGQKQLAEVLTGLRHATSGSFKLNGRHLTNLHPLKLINAGIAYIPESRIHTGSVGSMSVTENIALKHYRSSPGPFLDRRQLRNLSRQLVEAFNVDTPGIDTNAGTLSGGNLQKLILARELTTDPKFIVAAHPTQGLDVGASESVRNRLLEQQQQGVAVLLISEDLDELFSLSDRIGVLYEGRLMGIVDAQSATREEIGLMMTGKLTATTQA